MGERGVRRSHCSPGDDGVRSMGLPFTNEASTNCVPSPCVGELCKALLNESKVFIRGRLAPREHRIVHTSIPAVLDDTGGTPSDHMVNAEDWCFFVFFLQSPLMKLYNFWYYSCEELTAAVPNSDTERRHRCFSVIHLKGHTSHQLLCCPVSQIRKATGIWR